MEVINKSNSINGCFFGEAKRCTQSSTIDVQRSALEDCSNANNSCSLSKCIVEQGLDFAMTEVDYMTECSAYDIVTKVLRKCFLKKESYDFSKPFASMVSVDIEGDASCSITSVSCKMCCQLDNPPNMLICDLCGEAFHLSCFNPRVKNIPTDEWYCKPCLKKKPKPLLGIINSSESLNTTEGKYMNKSPRRKCCPISSMLEDTEPYTTGVRIGKAFQADVPDWSGPISKGYSMASKYTVADLIKVVNENNYDAWPPMLRIFLDEKDGCRAMETKVKGNGMENQAIMETYKRWKAFIEALAQNFGSKIVSMQTNSDAYEMLFGCFIGDDNHMLEQLAAEHRSCTSGMTESQKIITIACSLQDYWTSWKKIINHNDEAIKTCTDLGSQLKHDVDLSVMEGGGNVFESNVQGPKPLKRQPKKIRQKGEQQRTRESKPRACKMRNKVEQPQKKRKIV